MLGATGYSSLGRCSGPLKHGTYLKEWSGFKEKRTIHKEGNFFRGLFKKVPTVNYAYARNFYITSTVCTKI